jgi:zinc protease
MGKVSIVIATVITSLGMSCTTMTRLTGQQSSAQRSPLTPFTKVTLDNGLDIIVKEAHSEPIVAVYLWCKTGSVNEEPKQYGISHFYEHMFFKGTTKRGLGEMDRVIKGLGGYNNAFTSNEFTAYYVVLPSANFSLAADVLVDAIRNSAFPEDEITKECGVICEEINRKEDNPTGELYEQIFEVAFKGTPYGHPVLGNKESVSSITRDDFKTYLGRYYVPNNITAVVVGDVKTEDTIKEFKRLTKDWQPNYDLIKSLHPVVVKHHEGIQTFSIEKDVNMSYVLIAFQTSGYQNMKENAVLDVVSTLLGEGRSSRLYRRLVEKDQIVSSVNAYIYPLKRAGLFVIFGTMESAHVEEFKKAVIEEVEKLLSGQISPEELKKAKTMLKADYQFSNETDSNIAGTIGQFHVLGLLDNMVEYEKTIDEVTAKDVCTVSSRVLDTQSYTVGEVKQQSGESGSE